MEVVIITGMSGAGKTAALNLCQDNDYYSLDNLPPKLIKDVINLLQNSKEVRNKLALVIDIRGGEFFSDLYEEINKLKENGVDIKLLFIDATDKTLIKRYKELRRPHPQGRGKTIEKAIQNERKQLETLRGSADYYLDTSNFNLARLKYNLGKILGNDDKFMVQIVSFGFKHGILNESDYVFDVRFSENPFYIPELRKLSGLDKEVSEFILGNQIVKDFIDKIETLMVPLFPNFEKQGKSNLIIGVGCTGGQHRSVAIAEELYKRLSENDIRVEIYHRDQNLW